VITVALPVLTLTNEDTDLTAPYLIDLPGWDDSADVKRNLNRRSQGHGVFGQDPVYDDAKFFTVVGRKIDPVNPDAITALRSTLMRLKQLSPGWAVTITDGDVGPRTAYVELAGKISFDTSQADVVADFSIPLMMKDPHSYGPTITKATGLPTSGGGIEFPITFPLDFHEAGTSGRIITTNLGETETVSTLSVSGGLSGGFSLICIELGFEIRLEREIPAGSVVTVDMRTGQAFIDDQSPVSGFLTSRQWWTNPPGETRTIQFTSIGSVTGTPILTAYTAPAYN
jgi:hypothetical protein